MQYTFVVGQAVRARGRFPGRTGVKIFRVAFLLPVAGDEVPRYRVRSVSDSVEWTVDQDCIEACALTRRS